ncbi:tRNA-specific 2-thiouridylase [Apibacter mensalis]|uniref:tRNA-specific 2-thiouridylase MnmA n=1 Tax=Apibacter mensalis TaxID=1586267 RepID=A0A0X3ANN0_9FLAO|nr:tRNA 2-thiouridine(34) synthase MnmA [Apibacter mensalis]CVK15843.1 tRNA-specific 2-thiouridylase [Apibacter mensalis]
MKVVVGLSGGVDSSVAAYLLQQQGHEVIGLFMKNWNDSEFTLEDECPWVEDSNDAMLIARKLNIPYQVVDLSEIYKERIVDYMFHEYESGRTPNPDILCNREIKFDIFLKTALSLGADKVATGHYARINSFDGENKTIYRLLSGLDTNKDQSYFLCQLNQYQLSKTLFPIGNLTKPEVRQIAQEIGLITAYKKDSQGLCFIGKIRLPDFLQQKLKPKKGKLIEIFSDNSIYKTEEQSFESKEEELIYLSTPLNYNEADGKIIGEHSGAHYYTIGQRKGLGIGGHVEPCFVIDTDVRNNTIYVGEGKNHPGLFRKALFIDQNEVHWVREDLKMKIGDTLRVRVRIRYRQSLQNAVLYQFEKRLYIEFENLQSAITRGQFAAWYVDDELIGSGVIS